MDTGRLAPQLEHEPVLRPRATIYLEAFFLLMGSRPAGMGGVSPIPTSEIKDYCILMDITSIAERKDMLRFIKLIDSIYVAKVNRRLERKRQAQKTQANVRRR